MKRIFKSLTFYIAVVLIGLLVALSLPTMLKHQKFIKDRINQDNLIIAEPFTNDQLDSIANSLDK